MADQNTDLPEGTDKIVAGASETGVIGSGSVVASAAAGASGDQEDALITVDARDGGPSSSGGMRRRLRNSGAQLSGQAADKARGFVGQGLERSSEALANVSRMIGDTAAGIDERLGEEYGDYARRAAETIENTANSLASKDPDELIDDTRDFVRKSPGVALAGAAVVGFALARLIKSGLAADRGSSPSKRSEG